jgi:hypothetical protein
MAGEAALDPFEHVVDSHNLELYTRHVPLPAVDFSLPGIGTVQVQSSWSWS